MNSTSRPCFANGLTDGGAPLARADASEADTPHHLYSQPFVVPPDTDRHHEGSVFHDMEVTP